VLLPDGAVLSGDSTPEVDVRASHSVEVTAVDSKYTVAIDGVRHGPFSGPPSCGSVAIRVWGGATVRLDHLVVRH
jgi:hypothetical protein